MSPLRERWSTTRARRDGAASCLRAPAQSPFGRQPKQWSGGRTLAVGRVACAQGPHGARVLVERLEHRGGPQDLNPGQPGPVVVVAVHGEGAVRAPTQVTQARGGSSRTLGLV